MEVEEDERRWMRMRKTRKESGVALEPRESPEKVERRKVPTGSGGRGYGSRK